MDNKKIYKLMAKDKTYTVKEAAAKLKISTAKVYQLMQEGKIPATKKGRRWVITDENIIYYINEHRFKGVLTVLNGAIDSVFG